MPDISICKANNEFEGCYSVTIKKTKVCNKSIYLHYYASVEVEEERVIKKYKTKKTNTTKMAR